MKATLSILKWTLAAVGGVVALILLAVSLVLVKPSLVFNRKTLEWGGRQARQAGVDLNWTHGDLSVESVSLLRKRLHLKLADLCLGDPSEDGPRTGDPEAGCFDDLDFNALIDFSRVIPRLLELGPIKLLGGEVKIRPSTAPAKPPAEESKADPRARKWISAAIERMRLLPVQIEIDHWEVVSADGSRVLGSLGLHTEAEQESLDRPELKLVVDAQTRPAKKSEVPAKFGLELVAKVNHATSLAAELRKSGAPMLSAEFGANARFSQGRTRGVARLDGNVDPNGLDTRIQAELDGSAKLEERVRLNDCRFKAKREDDSRHPGSLELDCPLVAEAKLPPSLGRGGQWSDLGVPSRIGARVVTKFLSSAFPPLPDSRWQGTAKIQLDPILTPLMKGQGGAKAELAGVPADFPRGWKADTELAVSFLVPDFQKIVKRLARTAWAIPAPMSVLQGTVSAGITGKADLAKGEFPVKLQTRLASPGQKFDLDAFATMKVVHLADGQASEVVVDGQLMLSDVWLQLPRLDLEAPPRFIPDSRIVHGAPAKVAKSDAKPVRFGVNVQTPPEQPARITSNLAKAPIPIQLRLALDESGGPTGTIEVLKFPVEVFRRKATLERFILSLEDPSGDSPISGELRIPYTDYLVKVGLVGTASKPQVVLSSIPPLPQDQVLATLLFGAPTQELDSDQASSVGSTQAALADQALGLVSLYALASTPVQSVGYDARTGMFTAKVRLAEGTSLNVGTSRNEVSQIGVRKRLGPHWSIRTDYGEDVQKGGNTATAFLEWSNRY